MNHLKDFYFKTLARDLFFVALFLIAIIPNLIPGTDSQLRWVQISLSVILLLSYVVSWKIHFSLSMAVGYFLISGVATFMWIGNRYGGMPEFHQLAMRWKAADGVFKLLLISMLIFAMSLDFRRMKFYGKWFFCGLYYSSFLMMVFQYFKTGCQTNLQCGGLLMNPSMNICLMVCIYFLMPKFNYAAIISTLTIIPALIMAQSSIGIGMFIVGMGLTCYKFLSIEYLRRGALALFILSLVPAAYTIKNQGQAFFNSHGRSELWQFFLEKTTYYQAPRSMPEELKKSFQKKINYPNLVTGLGFGTFDFWSMQLQSEYGFNVFGDRVHHIPTMHNDFLEGYIVGGILGFLLILFAYFVGLYRMIKYHAPNYATAYILMGFYCAMNYPFHNPYSALFGAWLLAIAHSKFNVTENFY